MTIKDELHELIDQLDDDSAGELLEYAQWLQQPEDTLTDEERARVEAGEAEIRRGDYVTLKDLRDRLGR
jgi:hypothetical protein